MPLVEKTAHGESLDIVRLYYFALKPGPGCDILGYKFSEVILNKLIPLFKLMENAKMKMNVGF